MQNGGNGSSDPTRNLALELARVTEAAALAAGRFMGRGDKEGADGAAVNAMRVVLQTVDMNGIIVIGEGEKDNAPMLYNGENVGNGMAPDVDVAVDPIDGTRPLAFGRSNSLATVAMAPRGTMFDPGPFVYMNKLAVGPEAKGVINIEKSITENLQAIARAKDKDVEDLTTIILDRPPGRRAHSHHPGWRCGCRADDRLARLRCGRSAGCGRHA
jgi:fructose-1,6-bisphosphatase II